MFSWLTLFAVIVADLLETVKGLAVLADPGELLLCSRGMPVRVWTLTSGYPTAS